MISTQESLPDAAKKQRSRVSFDIAKDDEVIDVKQKNVNTDDEAGAASSDPDVSDDSTLLLVLAAPILTDLFSA